MAGLSAARMSGGSEFHAAGLTWCAEWPKMNFLRQGYGKLSSNRQIDKQTGPKLYTTPLRGWPITVLTTAWMLRVVAVGISWWCWRHIRRLADAKLRHTVDNCFRCGDFVHQRSNLPSVLEWYTTSALFKSTTLRRIIERSRYWFLAHRCHHHYHHHHYVDLLGRPTIVEGTMFCCCSFYLPNRRDHPARRIIRGWVLVKNGIHYLA